MYIVGMKVYYFTSEEGLGKYKEQHQIIGDILKLSGVEILQATHPKSHPDGQYASLTSAIHETDACIIECSCQSVAIGVLISKALELEKPVIALYQAGSEPSVLFGITNEKFQLAKYSKATAPTIIRTALEKASLMTDKRFNFFVSSSMLAYLNSISRSLGVTKSTFIRNLIEEYRRKHD